MLSIPIITAWRHLMRNKMFSCINVVGLTIGLTSFLLIALYIFDETTFDHFHQHAGHIYRLVEQRTTPEGQATRLGATNYQVSVQARAGIPEVNNAVRLAVFGRINISTLDKRKVFYDDLWISNPGFLETFDFELLQGDRHTALNAPHAVVVTEETALRLFNTSHVLGKRIKADFDSVPFQITGVLKTFPVNSQFSFNLLFSEATILNPGLTSDWSSNSFHTYLLLDSQANPQAVAAKINQLAAANRPPEDKDKRQYALQPLKEVHFNSQGIEGTLGKTGSITYIYVFSLIALFILVLACINYINLTTALYAQRAKEIGVRKMIGATRQNLLRQFLSEAFLTTLLALTLALSLLQLLLPHFNAFTQKQLSLGLTTDPRIWLGVVLLVLLIGVLAGLYPALFQSRLKPLVLYKGRIPVGKAGITLRQALVVFQFAVSISMILATLVVYRQMRYLDAKDMGFDKTQLLVVDINSGKVRRGAETIQREMAQLPQVKQVTVSSRVPGEWKEIPEVAVQNSLMPGLQAKDMFFLGVDEHFLAAYAIRLVKGRNFGTGNLTDSSAVLLNETAARELGITEPAGQTIRIPATKFGGSPEFLDQPYRARVVGIVHDFNFQSLREPLAPMVLGYKKNPIQSIDYFTVRVGTGHTSATLKQMEAILHRQDQDHLFEYHFLDDQWDLFYREDKIRQTIFLWGAALAISIGCLGLFGLTTFAAGQRTKEIGIRKVLGASVQGIVVMLSKDFLKLVLLAAIIAFPVAWWTMHRWLQEFAYRIDLAWWLFALAGSLGFLIALLTVSFQAFRAAIANPVKSLHNE